MSKNGEECVINNNKVNERKRKHKREKANRNAEKKYVLQGVHEK
jgi:hypothetical protein